MHGVEEFIPYRDAGDGIDPLDLESGCLVLDLCQAKSVETLVCNCREAPPDQDGFCHGLCYSWFFLA